jgi:ferredoxin/flavodoxin---NADP+ reductase
MPHVAVIGAGPSGIFATAELLKRSDMYVDVFDRLPTPFGLVRYGVAPDHLKIKSVTAALAKVLGDPRVHFHGNVEYGTDLYAHDLHGRYDAVLFATGAPLARRLGVPGEELPGNYAAADLVSWYNGHPDAGRAFDTPATAVAVIGAGNVSLDVARILLKGGTGLSATDVPDEVLAALDRNQVADVHVIVRRTAADVKFSPAELLELENLDDLDIVVDSADLANDGQQRHEDDRTVAQRAGIFRRWAQRGRRGATKRLFFRFLRSPVAINGSGRVGSVRLQLNTLDADGRLNGSRGTEELPVQAVICSIGYFGQPLQGIAFDAKRGLVPNIRGRVAPGVYVTGWIKRGPSGIIGSNKACAIETVEQMLAELAETRPQTDSPRAAVATLLRRRGCHAVDWSGWTDIDAAEIALGRRHGRARTKITDRRRLVEIGATAAR